MRSALKEIVGRKVTKGPGGGQLGGPLWPPSRGRWGWSGEKHPKQQEQHEQETRRPRPGRKGQGGEKGRHRVRERRWLCAVVAGVGCEVRDAERGTRLREEDRRGRETEITGRANWDPEQRDR